MSYALIDGYTAGLEIVCRIGGAFLRAGQRVRPIRVISEHDNLLDAIVAEFAALGQTMDREWVQAQLDKIAARTAA